MTPEGKVKADIKKYFKTAGIVAFWPVPTGMGRRDVDCLACIAGHFWAIEVKRPGAGATIAQFARLCEWRAGGARAVVVDSLDLLKRYIAEHCADRINVMLEKAN